MTALLLDDNGYGLLADADAVADADADADASANADADAAASANGEADADADANGGAAAGERFMLDLVAGGAELADIASWLAAHSITQTV